MKWRKLGKIFCADKHSDWLFSHAMVPIAEHITDDLFRIYFTSRDKFNRGHGGYIEIDIKDPTCVLKLYNKPILEPGSLGCFDDSGVIPTSIVNVGNKKLLYYTGINLGVTVKFRASIGLAEWNNMTHRFERCFEGPVIDRTKKFPHFVNGPEVHYENNCFRAWFSSCIGWKAEEKEPKHFYRIEYAESFDGVDWCRDGTVAIDFQDEFEYAIVLPRVIKDESEYKMWFCSRATKEYDAYRIRYATSIDGVKWERKDQMIGIDVSENGWDSQMICYPFVFDHNGERYMLYNGNDYGKTGFGIAILENE